MKIWPVCMILAAAALLLGTARPGVPGWGASGAYGEHGAGQLRSAWGPGSHGNAVVPPRSTWHSGVPGPEGGPHPPFVHDHFRGHPQARTRIFIGPDVWWGEPWWWGPAYPYYAAPPLVVPEEPPVYIQQEPAAQQPYYWYYCQKPQGYYPYIRECPGGWMTVVPPLGAGHPGTRETRPGLFASEGQVITLILSHGQELGLTPEQIQKLQELRTTFEKEAVERVAAIRAAEVDLQALLEKDQWDMPAIEAKVRQLATLQGDLRVARIKMLAAGRALLTPDQLQKLEVIVQWTPPPGGPERMGPGPPAGPGGPGPLPPQPAGPPTPRQ